MASINEKKPQWLAIGRSITSDPKNTIRKEVKMDDYYVVVGFEVNQPQAFVDDTQDLAVDYGHAFFYEVKNGVVHRVFSFGPNAAGKVGWNGKGGPDFMPNAFNRGAILKDGYQNDRPGTPDYGISEKVTAFKVPLSIQQGLALEKETDAMRQRIISKKQKYTAYMNDTCAETARDVLDSAGINTPDGNGWIRHSGMASFALVKAINPYMWHKNFAKSGYKTGSLIPPATTDNWTPPVGENDPIF